MHAVAATRAVFNNLSRMTPMRISFLTLALCLVVLCDTASAQSSIVYNRLRMIVAGKADEVRKELPELTKDFPDEPGIMFLNAVLTEDGSKALVQYEQITREHPQSEWADDAELRIVQYYALKKDTAHAQRELGTFKRNYPLSEFLIHAVELVKATVGLNAPSSSKLSADKAGADKATSPTKGSKESILVESKPNDLKNVTSPGSSLKAAEKGVDKSTEKLGEKAADKTAAAAVKKSWGLQVGVYTTKNTADAEAAKYREQRMKVDVTSKDGKYGVVVGNYSSRESADKSKEIIQAQCQCSPIVVEK